MAATRRRLDALTKPPGSLGRLEELVVWLAGVTGRSRRDGRAAGDPRRRRRPRRHRPGRVRLPGGRHGPDGRELRRGRRRDQRPGAAGRGERDRPRRRGGIGHRHRAHPATRGATLVTARVRTGTADMTVGAAMTAGGGDRRDRRPAGRPRRAIADGADVIGLGEMGIGNTTAASAITAVALRRPRGRRHRPGHRDRRRGVAPEGRRDRTGRSRSTGRTPRTRSASSPPSAGSRSRRSSASLGAPAAARVPVVLDGFITGAAALIATRLQPAVGRGCWPPTARSSPGTQSSSSAGPATRCSSSTCGSARGRARRSRSACSGGVPHPRRDGDVRVGRRLARGERQRVTLPQARPTEAILVRHASTDWTGVRFCGTADPPLNDAGRREAETVAARLAPTCPAAFAWYRARSAGRSRPRPRSPRRPAGSRSRSTHAGGRSTWATSRA